MPNIPALSKQRHRLSQIQGKLVLHREFQKKQGYTVRFCPKKQNKQTREKKNPQVSLIKSETWTCSFSIMG